MNENVNQTKASFGIKLLCFFIPLAGLIIFATNSKTNPTYAKGCGLASLIGMIILTVVMTLFIFVFGTFLYYVDRSIIANSSQIVTTQREIENYNRVFESYESSNLSASRVKSLLLVVQMHNETYEAENSFDDYFINVKFNGKRIGTNYTSVKLDSDAKYNVEMQYDYDGYIYEIVIKERSRL